MAGLQGQLVYLGPKGSLAPSDLQDRWSMRRELQHHLSLALRGLQEAQVCLESQGPQELEGREEQWAVKVKGVTQERTGNRAGLEQQWMCRRPSLTLALRCRT